MRGIAGTAGAGSECLAPECRQRQYRSLSACIQGEGDLHCRWWHLGSYPYRICRSRCRCRCRCRCLFSSHCEPATVTGLSRVKPQLQPSAAATAARVASSSKSEGKVKPHLQQSAAATAARVATEARVNTAARVATATTCTSDEGSLLRSIPRSSGLKTVGPQSLNRGSRDCGQVRPSPPHPRRAHFLAYQALLSCADFFDGRECPTQIRSW